MIPFRREVLIKAVSDPRVHFAHFQHAIDFVLSEGTKLLAAATGEVLKIKVDSNKGGSDPKYAEYTNYMIVKHNNGEYSYYSHLSYEGALAKVGDRVEEGQPIAISGNTGFSTAPHLHFAILKLNNTEVGWETLKVRFKEEISIEIPRNTH